MLESALESRFREQVRAAGGLSFKLDPRHAAGIPDRLVLLPGGRLYLVELKAAGGALRPIQRVWHDRAAALGTNVVTLTGTEEVQAWLAAV